MRTTIQLAAALLITITATSRAQVSDPNKLIAPPPPPIRFHGTHVAIPDLQWLWQYTQPAPDGNEAGLLVDPHFDSLLKDNLKAPQSFFRDGKVPLSAVARSYFGMIFSPVHGIDNRYITFSSCVPHDCTRHGLIWVDTAPQHPIVVFAATEWATEGKPESNPDAEYNLWVFSSRPLDPEHPPATLVTAISDWISPAAPQHIKTALVIDPDGTPHQVNPTVLGATPSLTTKN